MMKKLAVAIAVLGCLCIGAQAQLMSYSQNFEGLNAASGSALGDDGWLTFVNVFDSAGNFLYVYSATPFATPNGTGNIAGIVSGQGGTAQGDQQLVAFNDYANTDHGLGNLIEVNTFQEMVVGAGDVGNTWTFSYDAKLGNLEGDTTAIAFIKTLDPNNGYELTNFKTNNMAAIPTTWDTYSIDIDIDSSLAGQIIQFGFANTASNYEGSGVYYDNINVIPEPSSIALLLVAAGGLWGFRRRSVG
jgi:hypothetical protein